MTQEILKSVAQMASRWSLESLLALMTSDEP